MDSLSALDPLAWDPAYLREHPAYVAGNAFGWLYRGDKQASTNHAFSGRLYLSKSNWLLLSVPNAFVRGLFDAMTAPGAELPTKGVWGLDDDKPDVMNAHISVMSAEEVEKIGPDKINERGHTFHYSLGKLEEFTPKAGNVSKVWVMTVTAPGLTALRKSYGLSPMPNGDHQFHITIAARRKNVLQPNGISKGNATDDGMPMQSSSRGELKAAAATDTTYECGCSGPCTCPETCVCKKTGCGRCKAASTAEIQHSNTLSRTVTKDLLHGGKADNVPDRDFSSKALAEGQADEHEHTDNDQIAKEIAKDHLSSDPAYYAKEKLIEKLSRAQIIEELLAAKNHSDNKRYGHKAQILRKLMSQSPQDWQIDDDAPKFKGITHMPTKFRFHTDPTTIPSGVKAAFNVPNTDGSVYAQQFANLMNFQHPLVYDNAKPVFANVMDHLSKAKQRGDFILNSRQNMHMYRTQLDPQYRYQMALAAVHGTLPQMNPLDKATQMYGNDIFDSLKNLGGRKNG